MKISYSNNLEYQTKAVESVLGLFEGSGVADIDSEFALKSDFEVVANYLDIHDDLIQNNLKRIQSENFSETEHRDIYNPEYPRDFSIEMETGTGKTYTYVKTVFELHKKYHLRKFIIAVPSVAIREGVMKTLQTTSDHFFDAYYTRINFSAYEGDTKTKTSLLKQFTTSSDIELVVMSIQAFNSDNNIINQDRDDSGRMRMIDRVAHTNPVIILDEPQNMESELSQSALASLNPLFTLRYSATHKNLYNLLYSLSPYDAYNQGLVKKIEIASVILENANERTLEVLEIKTGSGNPKVKLRIEIKKSDGRYEIIDKLFSLGDNLQKKTKNSRYEGLFIEEISAHNKSIEITGGEVIKVAEEQNETKIDLFRVQIRETIREHMERQEKFGTQIKVLSLFFIDKVANYVHEDSLIREIFEQEFNLLKEKYSFFKTKDVKSVHNGYFSSTGKTTKKYKDTKGNSKNDTDVYQLIMRDKERLLSFDENISFIFSHSALKEGWDNPNVFQVCTLNETVSLMKKRQEIGRGMRLCLDVNGNRVYDRSINTLVVIPNESYKSYVATLQSEFKQAGQIAISTPQRKERKKIRLKKLSNTNKKAFEKLWNHINQKTKYSFLINSDNIIEKVINYINENISIETPAIVVERHDVSMRDNVISAIYSSKRTGKRSDKKYPISEFIDRLATETNMTRKTIFTIMEGIDNLDIIFDSPEQFIRSVAVIIKETLHGELVHGIEYTKLEEFWDMKLFADEESYADKVIQVNDSIYDYVVYDSDGEKDFAMALDESSRVKLFAKLPAWFVIDTPVGNYNPDWAIVWEENNSTELYLVRETKFYKGKRLEDVLKQSELQKIFCARKHFSELGVDFAISQSENLEDILK